LRKVFRAIKWLVGGLLVILIVGAIAGYISMRGSLPQLDGEIAIKGPSAPITIVRDKNAVPHITAATMNDAYFAVGFLQAQDRFWQMHMNRRIAAGRISEMMGRAGLKTDKFLRTLGVYRKAKSAYGALDNETKASLQAYADGVNAWLDSQSGSVTPEFLFLWLPKPEHWHPVDSLAWLKMMSWDLGGNWTKEISRLELAARLPMDKVQEFFPLYPGEEEIVLPDLQKLYGFKLGKSVQVLNDDDYPALLLNSGQTGVGSNNWVVSGARTKTGKPLLANDPHLGLTAPAIWYHVNISVPSANYNAIGATLPSAPFIILGRNQHIAWGFTNTGPDVQDLYIERLTAQDKIPQDGISTKETGLYYDTPDGPKRFKIIDEILKVRGGDDVKLRVRVSRHGPVMSDVLEKLPGLLGKNHVLAFQWTALADTDFSAVAAFGMSRATKWDDFKQIVGKFSSPEQNMVFADIEGNIGYFAPGLVPVRKAENKLKGLAPAPGWVADYDWQGFIPLDELPRRYNPESGVIFTANQKIVGDDYKHFITSEWTLPYRANRIESLLAATQKHTIASFVKIQSDVTSLFVKDLLPQMLKFTKGVEGLKDVHALMSKWNGSSTPEWPEMLIFAYWYDEMIRDIIDDDAPFLDRDASGKVVKKPRHRTKATFIGNVLRNKDGQGAWCGTVGKDNKADCKPIVVAALEKALEKIKATYGGEFKSWKWGKEHIAVSEHRPMGNIPLLDKLFNVTVPTGGGPHTVNVANYKKARMGHQFPSIHAASLRHIFDLSNLENSKFIYSAGQSGHPLSKFYNNFAKDWADVKYLPLVTDKKNYMDGNIGVLKLIPSGS
jgi:penicillin amidase